MRSTECGVQTLKQILKKKEIKKKKTEIKAEFISELSRISKYINTLEIEI